VSDSPLAIAFFDPEHGLSASARSGATLLFEGASAKVLSEGPAIEAEGGGWRAELEGAFTLAFEPVAESASLGGVVASVCRVSGVTAGGQHVSCLGTVAETRTPPEWEQLDALRSLSAVFDEGHAFLALGRRPRGAVGHGVEETVGWLLSDGEAYSVEDTRISTVYDGDGRQRSAGLELWLPGEEFPQRGSGTVVAGTSLELDGLQVHAAIFRWRLGVLEGLGAYELWVRDEQEAA
jgi:hypothetical protein